MNIAILGTGSVGRALGRGWADAGHAVVFGSRHPDADKAQSLVASIGDRAGATSLAEAAAAADVVALAIPWGTVERTLTDLSDLTGKVLIDCTNPLKPNLAGLAVDDDTSGAEQIAAWAPEARVVKAFNTTGANNMADPVYDGTPLTMFVCGNDAEAKTTVMALAEDLGFEAVDAGILMRARQLEPLALLWIHLATSAGLGREIGFKLLRR